MTRIGRLLRQIETCATNAQHPADFRELLILREDMLKAMGKDAPRMDQSKYQRKGQA